MEVKLESVTPEAEKIMAYCARVSNPNNQDNPDYAKLLAYCIKNQHWSIFEMADMTVEINTSRAISAQILRHKSFSFQEFSQRYANIQGFANEFEDYEPRRQDTKNRQNSLDDLNEEDKTWFKKALLANQNYAMNLYKKAIDKGIAKECARMFLPMNTATKLYMKGNVRSWIHYLTLRCDKSTQLEHRQIADAIKVLFIEQFPTVAKALEWVNNV